MTYLRKHHLKNFLNNIYLDMWLESLAQTGEIISCATTDPISAYPSHRIPSQGNKGPGRFPNKIFLLSFHKIYSYIRQKNGKPLPHITVSYI